MESSLLQDEPASRSWWRQQGHRLPLALRVYCLAPATVFLVVILGAGFTLPPGPLCDEGMVLFMEGGCDWGLSNVFFFSKLGLLISVNAAFIIAWLAGVRGYRRFTPHFVVALFLVLANWDGGSCDTYYSQPNGSIGQMVFEVASFAALGIAILGVSRSRSLWAALIVALVLNLASVGQFYLWLEVFDHWQWQHSLAYAGVNGFLAIFISAVRALPVWRSRGE